MSPRRSLSRALPAAVAFAVAASAAAAQQPPQASTAAPPAAGFPAVGDVAPDFALPGATRYGLLRDPVRLSDYRGQTVVLAFFFKARTRG
jgi:peroxiredoxin Q/BCP